MACLIDSDRQTPTESETNGSGSEFRDQGQSIHDPTYWSPKTVQKGWKDDDTVSGKDDKSDDGSAPELSDLTKSKPPPELGPDSRTPWCDQ